MIYENKLANNYQKIIYIHRLHRWTRIDARKRACFFCEQQLSAIRQQLSKIKFCLLVRQKGTILELHSTYIPTFFTIRLFTHDSIFSNSTREASISF